MQTSGLPIFTFLLPYFNLINALIAFMETLTTLIPLHHPLRSKGINATQIMPLPLLSKKPSKETNGSEVVL